MTLSYCCTFLEIARVHKKFEAGKSSFAPRPSLKNWAT